MAERLARRHRGAFAGIMLLAIATSVVAPDHWGEAWEAAAHGLAGGHGHAHSQGGTSEEAHHSRHCHGDSASCSNVPLTGIGGLALLAAIFAFTAPLVALRRVNVTAATLPCWEASPGTPPPRLLAS